MIFHRPSALVCQEMVELITDYLKGTLPRSQRRRFDAHLAGREHCTEYLKQMRTTIQLTGGLRTEDLTPERHAEFSAIYRRWGSEPQCLAEPLSPFDPRKDVSAMPIPHPISAFIDTQATNSSGSYSDLRVIVFNGTTKRSPEPSHTDGLLAIPKRIFETLRVRCDEIRTVDRTIPPGLWPDMREHGYDADDFPEIYRSLVEPADIIVIAGPIWLGDQSSQTRLIIERLYAYSSEVNQEGQWSYYGKVGGVLTTGNEDGGKHVGAQVLYALQHIGLSVPPQSDTYWNGEAGPGPSYLDLEGGGEHNAWTTRNTVFMTWNMLHLSRMLKDAGGFPSYGNSTKDWDLDHPEHPNPEYRGGAR